MEQEERVREFTYLANTANTNEECDASETAKTRFG